MPWSEDDDDAPRPDDAASRARRHSRDDSWDKDSPDAADLVPDDRETVRCQHCKKFIFHDSVRCPYCKLLQLEDEIPRKARWFVWTVIALLVGIGFWYLFYLLNFLYWIQR